MSKYLIRNANETISGALSNSRPRFDNDHKPSSQIARFVPNDISCFNSNVEIDVIDAAVTSKLHSVLHDQAVIEIDDEM